MNDDRKAVDTRLKFLTSAALLYAPSATAISAHLMLQCIQVADENERPLDIKAPNDVVCRACGTVSMGNCGADTPLLRHRRDELSLDTSKIESSEKATASSPELELRCSACHRYLRQPVAATEKSSGTRSLKQQPFALSGEKDIHCLDNTATGIMKPLKGVHANLSVNASSKQRAKARKQGGLHAMLEQSRKRQQSNVPGSLDLMDFMRAS